MSEHPALDKLHAATQQGSQEIGAFIDWLGQQGYLIANYRHETYRVEPNRFVFDADPKNGRGVEAPIHRTTDRCTEPALCGAQPQPFTSFGIKYTVGWYGELGQRKRQPWNDASQYCAECERKYQAGEWPEQESIETHLLPVHKSINDWLAEYLGVDLDAVERERRALLDELRAATTPRS